MRKPIFPACLVFLILCVVALSAKAIDIGPMTWTPRSDWINVTNFTVSGTTYHADNTGATDASPAIQAALRYVQVNHYGRILTIYFPAGTYKLMETLTIQGVAGVTLVGCGSDTILKWYGSPGAAMFWPSGTDYMHYIGLTWDGNNLAACAYEHYSPTVYETRIRHEYESFKNIVVTGTYMPGSSPPACAIISGFSLNNNGGGLTADSMMFNCCFNNCTYGFINPYQVFNNFEWVIDSCEFENCGTGVDFSYFGSGSDWVVSNCHFLSSTNVDIQGAGSVRARHCTSYGSAQFAVGLEGSSILQDCSVAAWTNTNCAVSFVWIATPQAMFDCTFTNPPTGALRYLEVNGQSVSLSNNYAPNFPGGFAGWTNSIYAMEGLYQNIQPGLRFGSVGLLLSATQTFLHTGGFTDSTNIIDVTQAPYTADPTDVKDSTATIQAAINAAQTANNGSVVYIPTGIYKISSTLTAGGSNYTIQGSGIYSELCWYGASGSTMLAITTPTNLEVQQLRFAEQYGGTAGIVETSAGASNLVLDDVYYEGFSTGNPGAGGDDSDGPGIVLSNLPAGSTVYMPHLNAPLTVQNCGAAQIYSKYLCNGVITVSGTGPKTGFLGALATEGGQQSNLTAYNVVVTDNQNLILEDYYYEQCRNGIELESGSGNSPGYVAIQGFNAWAGVGGGVGNAPTAQIMVNNYQGTLLYGWTPFGNDTGLAPVQITQTGTNPFNMLLEGNSYDDGLPTINTSNANLIWSQNLWQSAGGQPLNLMSDNPNPLTGANLALLAEALDPFRQLEAIDLSVQFGISTDGPPVAAYAFENDATDMTGNYNGINYGATYPVGAIGMETAGFSGTGAYIQIPNPLSSGSGNFSISMWIQTNDTGGTGQWYNGHGLVDGETGAGQADFGTALVGGKFALGVGNPDTTLLTTGTVNDGKWHHLVATYATSGTMQVFVDGVLNNSMTGPAGTHGAPTSLRFGGILSGTTSGYYNGLLDQVQIYNYVLSGSEAAYLYNYPRGANPLVGYWKLNETSGTTSYDSSPSGENGTWVNSPVPSTSYPPAIASSNAGSLLFNGTNQYVTVATTAALPTFTSPRTLSVWAKTNKLTGNHIAAAFGTTGNGDSFFIGQYGTTLEVGGFNSDVTVPNFWDTNWHHIVATYNGTTCNVYADGMIVASAAKAWTVPPPFSCTIGNYINGTGYPWSGNIADVRIYNRVLTASEVGGMDISVQAITSPLNVTGTNSFPFSYQITANSGPTTYGSSVLPANLSLNSTSGLINGSLSGTGNSTVTITAANSTGTCSATLVITSVQTPPPAITSSTSVKAIVGEPFTYQISGSNYPTSYAAPSHPAWIGVNSGSGLITGTATTSGTTTMTVSAINAGGTGSATVAIQVQMPYAAWQSQMFSQAQLGNSSISGDTATPAGDGISNLMKYALYLNPWTDGVAGLPALSIITTGSGNYPVLTYTRPIFATDVTYTVQVSTDMQSWYSGPGYTTLPNATNNSNGVTQSVTVQDLTPVTPGDTKQFMRLEVTGT